MILARNPPANHTQIGLRFNTMITTSFYLDTRATQKGAEAPLKISVTKNGSTTYLPVGVSLLPSQWDKVTKKVVGHPRKTFLNTYIQQKKLEIDEVVLTMMKDRTYLGQSVTQIKKAILAALNPVEQPKVYLLARLRRYADTFTSRTKLCYEGTIRRILAYTKDAEKFAFEDITEEWLNSFDAFLAKTAPAKNARNIHFRNIRTVFNEARRDGITTFYPFEKGRFSIKSEPTRKRSFKVEVLRQIFSAEVEPWQQRYLDIFKLIFMLIGINFVDLYNLTAVEDGRVEYRRAKTKRLYSIKVEPEALQIINRYVGKKNLLDLADRSPKYRISYMQTCKGLVAIRKKLGIPELSSYWARHSWATVAASLDIPRDTIAHALGHGGNTVTDIYIDFDQKKVDEANRKVLDWVLYGKR